MCIASLPDKEDGEDSDVKGQETQEAALLLEQASTGELVHHQGEEVAHHGGAAVQLLSLRAQTHSDTCENYNSAMEEVIGS